MSSLSIKKHFTPIISVAGMAWLVSFSILADMAISGPSGWDPKSLDWPSRVVLAWPPLFGQHYVVVGIGFQKGLDFIFWGSTFALLFIVCWIVAVSLKVLNRRVAK